MQAEAEQNSMSAYDFFRDRKNIDSLKCSGKYSFSKLKVALLESVELNCRGIKKAAVLFSGGVDSSLLAMLASLHTDVTCICNGFKNSPAFERSEKSAGLLGLKLRKIEIKETEIPGLFLLAKKILKTTDSLQLEIGFPLNAFF